MNESEYYSLVDHTLNQIENALDELGVDFDYEISDGMLSFEFENGVKIILSRQTPLSQLWLATPSGAYHFDYDASKQAWLDEKNKEPLVGILSQHCSGQSGEEIHLEAD
ncbi:iron donor protein CyaY [Nitrospira defluvii]|nr:iron donor protein CyaY [Nitrospira defluvii]